MAKAAIVIGIDRTGELDPLEGAAESATQVASWLESEGYNVSLFTDKDEPVHAEQVRLALDGIVTTPAQYELLVIYFSGHGYWHAQSDLWLFSDAPVNSADAINLTGATDVAKNCGVKTVVFISDACRNIPAQLGQRVKGIDALPNVVVNTSSKVDTFKATSQAASAYEARIPDELGGTGARESVMTKALRHAFLEPTEEIVTDVIENGRKVKVVPNRKLGGYLQDKVDELLAAVDPNLQQNLEVNVPSEDDVYLAKVSGPTARGPSAPLRTPDAGRLAANAAFDALTGAPPEPGLGGVAEAEVMHLMPRHDVRRSFESECGFVVSDAVITQVAVTHGGHGQIYRDDTQSGAAVVRVDLDEPGASLVAQLADGRSFVLPALSGYIGHVALGENGVSNVGYVPSEFSDRYPAYRNRQESLDRLRALVAVSVDHDSFRVNEEDAAGLADAIRVDKGLDPALGLYAAHAYSAAGLDGAVVDVKRYMWDDLGTSLYDVVLLASRMNGRDTPKVPFCPILTQTWNMVRPRGFKLHPLLDEHRHHLLDTLWTTFHSDAAGVLVDAVESGDLS